MSHIKAAMSDLEPQYHNQRQQTCDGLDADLLELIIIKALVEVCHLALVQMVG